MNDSLSGVPDDVREALARIWLSQAATEARVAHSFERVHRSLVELGADEGLVRVAARAVDDEHRHRDLCRDVAERYLGAKTVEPPVLAFMPPAHETARNDVERRALWVVGQCAFNETFASAYLSLALDRAEHPLARATLRELLSDEIDHARIGWAFLATLPPGLRSVIEEWLPPLAIANLREWRRVSLGDDPRLVAHGIPSAVDVEDALLTAVRDLVIPGLDHSGLDPRALTEWAAEGAPT